MRRCLLCLFLLPHFAGPLYAQTVDKAKLREAIEMPRCAAAFEVNYSAKDHDDLGNRWDPAKEIAKELRRLNGTVDDAYVYLKIASWHSSNEDEKFRATVRKAEELLKPHLNTNDPRKGHLLVWYSYVVEFSQLDPWDECEKLARRAIALSPGDWRTWNCLAWVWEAKAVRVLLGNTYATTPRAQRGDAAQRIFTQKLASKQVIDEVERYFNGARKYSDQANELAARNVECAQERHKRLMNEGMFRAGIAAARGEKPGLPAAHRPEVIAQAKLLGELCPADLYWQFTAIQTDLARLARLHGDKTPNPAIPLAAVPKDAWKYVNECMLRIEKIAEMGGACEGARLCRKVLIGCSFVTKDYSKMETYARAMLRLDPADTEAAGFVETSLLWTKRRSEADHVAREQYEKFPTARSAYRHAANQYGDGNAKEAEKILRAGLQKSPEDIACQLGLAAVLMATNDTKEALAEADQLLIQTKRLLHPERDGDFFGVVDYLRAIHGALTDNEVIARLQLEYIHSNDPAEDRAKRALAAFGK